jgi:hypothetical protein
MHKNLTQSNRRSSTSRADAPGKGHNSDGEAKLQGFLESYQRYRKEEGESYVRRCKVVVEAETDLNREVFDEFLRQVNLPRKSSKFRKVRAIAKVADRLLAISDRLPDSKSTIYELSILDADRFSQLIEDDVITPTVTAEQIRFKTREGKEVKCVVPIDATPLDHNKRLELLKDVCSLASRLGARVRVPKSLRGLEERK